MSDALREIDLPEPLRATISAGPPVEPALSAHKCRTGRSAPAAPARVALTKDRLSTFMTQQPPQNVTRLAQRAKAPMFRNSIRRRRRLDHRDLIARRTTMQTARSPHDTVNR